MDQELKNRRAVSLWFFISAGMVFAMVVIGAITRLTESGLSMVEWRVLIGALPPLNEAEWQRVFALYQDTPEFQIKNAWMELSDFKKIFFWEWFHRFWGRIIGMVYALPLLWFWVRGMLPAGVKWPALGLLVLGAGQGVLGWYMVESGLVDQPAVSHYRLAAHLGLAFTLFALLVWMGRRVLGHERGQTSLALVRHLWAVIACVVLTVFWGAYTAGLDAGMVYNDTFPQMGERWIPYEIKAWSDLFEDHVGVQFMHRWLAMGTVAMVLGFWGHAWKRGVRALEIHGLAIMAVLQMILGVVTLLSGVTLWIAAMHQAGALIVVLLCVLSLYRLRFDSYCGPGAVPTTSGGFV